MKLFGFKINFTSTNETFCESGCRLPLFDIDFTYFHHIPKPFKRKPQLPGVFISRLRFQEYIYVNLSVTLFRRKFSIYTDKYIRSYTLDELLIK